MQAWVYLTIFLGIASVNTKLEQYIYDTDLILTLQKYFNSKELLFASDDRDKAVNAVHKLRSTKCFMVLLNSDTNLTKFFQRTEIFFSQNSLLLIDGPVSFLRDLIHAQNLTFIRSIIWIMFETDNIQQKPQKLKIPVNVKYLFIRKKSSNFEVYRIHKISETYSRTSLFAGWENENLLIRQENIFQTTNLYGQKFNIARTTFVGKESKDQYERLWTLFSESMNFTIKWTPISPEGNFFQNGTKTGIFKMLHEHRIDGTPSYFVVSDLRLSEFDCIYPTAFMKTNIYVAVDKNLNWASFVAPFNEKVWILIVVSIFFSWGVGYFIRNLHGFHINEDNFPLFNSFRAFCYQAGKIKGKRLSYYVCYLIPYLLAVIVVQHYSAALQSFLMVKNSDPPFNDLHGVIANGKYKISIFNMAYALFYFNNNNGKDIVKAREKLLLPPDEHPDDPEIGFYQLCRRPWVFVMYTKGLKIRQNCHIVELKTPLFSSFDGILVWKGFPYRHEMTKMMKRLQSAGLAQWKYQNKIIPSEDPNQFHPYSLNIIFPLFLLLVAFTCLALVIFICESTIFKN